MPLRVAKVIVASLYLVTNTLLKLKALPDQDRKDLSNARDELRAALREIEGVEKGARVLIDLVERAEREGNGSRN